MSTRFCFTSDLHGNLPVIEKCDILCISGDLPPAVNHNLWYQELWFKTIFKEWIENSPVSHVVLIGGNHDYYLSVNHKLPFSLPNVHYLEDSSVNVLGFNIWGSPYSRDFYDWWFMLPEKELDKKWDLIPKNTDVVLTHNPLWGLGDLTLGGEHVGSITLRYKIADLEPKATSAGHIHSAYGQYLMEGTTTRILNSSYVNERYEPQNPPFVIELDCP